MERGGRLVTERDASSSDTWALARVHLGVLHPAPQLSGSDPIRVLFHGDLFNQAELAAELGLLPDAPVTEVARGLYRQSGPGFASRLKGSFCAAVLDDEARRVVLVTDRFGSYPLYWCQPPGIFAFGSEVRALVQAQSARALNPLAVNDLFQFGYPTGDRTLASGVQLLPASSTLTFEWPDGQPKIERYAAWASAFSSTAIRKPEYTDAVAHAFDVSMGRAVEGQHRYGLSLSGGLDTRVLLSSLDRMGVPLSTFTLGGKGCADEVIGYQLARMAHTNHQFVPLEEGYLADLRAMAERMVSLTDGMYTSHGFTEVLALRSFERSDFNVLLRGHLGELAKAGTAWPLHTDAQVFGMRSKAELIPYLLTRLESTNHGSKARGLFTDAWAAAADPSVARGSLDAALADADLSPADLCSYLYLTEYHRRVTVPSLEIFRNVAEVRLPLADEDFVSAVLQGPAKWRDGLEIHQTLVRRTNPKFLKVRNPNTGAPAGAGPVQEAILDKLNSVLRRLNVYGYRHYHAFDGWMRRTFLEIVDQVLLSPDTLGRGVLREAPVRQLVDTAKQGETAADHVLQVLVLIELWQRETA